MKQGIVFWGIFQILVLFLVLGCDEETTPPVTNRPPAIENISLSSSEVEPGGTVEIHVIASDPDGDVLQYSYDLTGGSMTHPDSFVTQWIAPQGEGAYPITVTVSDGEESVQESFTINVLALEFFGIYSETHTGVIPGSDGFIGTYLGGGATFTDFVDDTSEFTEGMRSKKSTMNVGSGGPWAGWFVQHGTVGTPDSETKDMSSFAGSYLRFSVKSPINLLVGIRSGNVTPGYETSTVLLSDYSSFTADNVWHQVSIPLSDFVGSPPKADLSIIKIFFNIASNRNTGGTGGSPKTFWIDDVVWTKPGR